MSGVAHERKVKDSYPARVDQSDVQIGSQHGEESHENVQHHEDLKQQRVREREESVSKVR